MNNNLNEASLGTQKSDGQACIIIHPGSTYLRLGCPSDSKPHTILHAIACKNKGKNRPYADPFLIPAVKWDRQVAQEVEECRLKASHFLQCCLKSDGFRRVATPPQVVAAFNRRSRPQSTKEGAVPSLKPSEEEFVVGDEILTLDTRSHHVHFPFRRGDLNVHSGPGGSLTSVLAHLKTIWTRCIHKVLDVAPEELKDYRAVLIIPDIYDRGHVAKLFSLLLEDMEFSSAFVIQDHVCATFGAGMGAACVLDVGAQKTSVSCVEDAISHPATRFRLDYGGDDVTCALHWLLRKSAFPVDVDATDPHGGQFLDALKKEYCHLNLDLCGAQESTLTLSLPGRASVRCVAQLGDELLTAPLSLFMVPLLRVSGPKGVTTQKANTDGHHNDPLDENFLRETTRLRGREASEAMLELPDGGDEELQGAEETPIADGPDDDCKLLSVEAAIIASINKCPTDEMKRKMYTNILVVGGGAKFDGFGSWLQNRISLQAPIQYRSEPVEVTTRPKDLDPMWTSWKGAALLTCLEGCSDLWISENQWRANGVAILREKCPFLW